MLNHDALTIRNTRLAVSIDTETLAGRIVAPGSGAGWRFDILAALAIAPGQIAQRECRLLRCEPPASEAAGIEADIALDGNQYRVVIRVESGAGDVIFELQPLSEAEQVDQIIFPGPLLPLEGPVTQLVLPRMATNGIVHRPQANDHWVYRPDAAGNTGLNMPFFGLQSADADLLVIIETADDVDLVFEKVVRRPLEVTTNWRVSLGRIHYPRRLRVRLMPPGTYVDMAKEYRAYVKAQGTFKTLAEKIAERPRAAQVVGGPYFSVGYLPFSERKFRQIVDGLRTIGYTNGIIGPIDHIQWDNGAWLNDYQAFIQAPQFRPIAAEAGFAAFSWLYLEDILTWDRYFDPEWVVRNADGSTIEGWFNRDYEYQLICTKVLKEKHSLLRDRMLQHDALHFDTGTSKSLTECWHPDHMMSRSEDRASRLARLAEVASWGLLIGSEGGYDWAFDTYDFCSSNPRRAMETGLPVPAEHIPLLGLVYHDSVVSYCWEYDPYNKSYFGVDWSEDKLLYDVMAGNPPTISPILGYFPVIRRPAPPVESYWVTWEDPNTQRLLRDALPVAQLHGKTAHHEMLEHTFLDDARCLTRTTYGDGTRVLVNFSHTAEKLDGIVVAPRSYHIG